MIGYINATVINGQSLLQSVVLQNQIGPWYAPSRRARSCTQLAKTASGGRARRPNGSRLNHCAWTGQRSSCILKSVSGSTAPERPTHGALARRYECCGGRTLPPTARTWPGLLPRRGAHAHHGVRREHRRGQHGARARSPRASRGKRGWMKASRLLVGFGVLIDKTIKD
jgi:hypothetical protein